MKINSLTKVAAVGVLALGAAGLGVASAVNLGIDANNELAAGTSVTATCQPAGVGKNISVGFDDPIYDDITQSFNVSQVLLGNIEAACVGADYKLVVADLNGEVLSSSEGVIGATTQNVSLQASLNAAEVTSISVVITR